MAKTNISLSIEHTLHPNDIKGFLYEALGCLSEEDQRTAVLKWKEEPYLALALVRRLLRYYGARLAPVGLLHMQSISDEISLLIDEIIEAIFNE